MSNERRQSIRVALVDALTAAAVDDATWCSVAELKDAGVPAKYASAISHESLRIATSVDALAAADEWATTIADAWDAEDRAVADGSIIRQIPRIS